MKPEGVNVFPDRVHLCKQYRPSLIQCVDSFLDFLVLRFIFLELPLVFILIDGDTGVHVDLFRHHFCDYRLLGSQARAFLINLGGVTELGHGFPAYIHYGVLLLYDPVECPDKRFFNGIVSKQRCLAIGCFAMAIVAAPYRLIAA